MRWLDRYLDAIYLSTSAITPPGFGPFSRLGSVFNVLFCAGVGIAFVVVGFSGSEFGIAPVIFPVALEVLFVRTCIRAFRGDFDDLPADDSEETPQ